MQSLTHRASFIQTKNTHQERFQHAVKQRNHSHHSSNSQNDEHSSQKETDLRKIRTMCQVTTHKAPQTTEAVQPEKTMETKTGNSGY